MKIDRPKALIVLICAMASAVASAVSLDMPDTFEDGTKQGWAGGDTMLNVPSDGPNGVDDNYLRLTSRGGFGAGSRLAAYNLVQWKGDFLTAGVNVIECDLRNEGSTDLKMRIVVFADNLSRWTSTVAAELPAGSGWRHVDFPINASTMTRVSGAGTFEDAYKSVQRLMIRHDEEPPSDEGTPIVAQLGIDNVVARIGVKIKPTAFTIFRGSLVSGGLADLFESDDSKLVVRRGPIALPQESPVTVLLDGTATTQPSAMYFRLEAAVTQNNIGQRIELFDFTQNKFVQIDSRGATTSDQTVTVQAPGAGSAYVEPTQKLVRARLSWKPTGPLFSNLYDAKIDQAFFLAAP